MDNKQRVARILERDNDCPYHLSYKWWRTRSRVEFYERIFRLLDTEIIFFKDESLIDEVGYTEMDEFVELISKWCKHHSVDLLMNEYDNIFIIFFEFKDGVSYDDKNRIRDELYYIQ